MRMSKGLERFVRYTCANAIHKGDPHAAREYSAARYRDPVLDNIFKAAVSGGTPTASAWADDLVYTEGASNEFIEAVRRVGNRGTALDPEVVAQLLARARRRDPLERLTPREKEVLALMAEGRSNPAIARSLVVSDKAVEKHVSNIFTKLDLPPTEDDHRRVLAVLQWVRS